MHYQAMYGLWRVNFYNTDDLEFVLDSLES